MSYNLRLSRGVLSCHFYWELPHEKNHKIEVPPEALSFSRIREQRRELAEYYKQLPAERVLSRPPFDPEPLYNNEVRMRLMREFQGRCAQCEQRVDTQKLITTDPVEEHGLVSTVR